MFSSIQFSLSSFLSHTRMVTFRDTMLFVDVFVCLEHDLEALWSFAVAASRWHLGGSVFGLEVIFCPGFWSLIHGCWKALKYPWRPAGCIWTVLNPQTMQSHKPAQFKQTMALWTHAVSHVPGVCASGRGNTSSRTPLIFLFLVKIWVNLLALNKDTVWTRLCLSLHSSQTANHMLTHWTQHTQCLPPAIHTSTSFGCSIMVWSTANLGRCLRNHPKTLMSTYACLAGRLLLANWQTCIKQLCRKQRCCLEETLSFFV